MAATFTISSSIFTPKYFPSQNPKPFVRLPKNQFFQITSINSKNRNFHKLLAAVSQEETAVTTSEETTEAVQEAVQETTEAVQEAVQEITEAVQEAVQETTEAVQEAVQEAAPANTKLYFGNLPYNCDSSQLAEIVQQYAIPEMVEVLYDRQTGRSRGFAFVTMGSVEDCELVIQNLDGSQFSGRLIRVNFSDKPRNKEPLFKETEHKLFVGNLSWSATSEDLEKLFKERGNVVSARVLFDGETGRSRGYGFVCYATKEEMEEALVNLDGAELDGREIRVSEAQSKRSSY